MYTQTHTIKSFEHQANNDKHEGNTCEQEPSISGTFVRLNVLDYKRSSLGDKLHVQTSQFCGE